MLIEELSEEDKNIFMTNLQKSSLYKFIENIGLIDYGLGTEDDKPEVKYRGHTVKYTVPENFEIYENNKEKNKIYKDNFYNLIEVEIKSTTIDSYMNELENGYVMTSDMFENKKISEIKTYIINGKEYKYRTISYNNKFGSYGNLYFAYELDDEYCYIVGVEIVDGMSMDIIENFLDVIIE